MDVYGDGPHRGEVVEIAAGAPVRFHGFVEGRADLSRRIAAADVALSVCPGETFGLAVLEALASGTPVVTADRGGARELVDDRSGAWAEPDPVALRRAELFPWQATVDRMLDVHAAVTDGALVPA